MPYRSEAQRRYLHARHPEIAARWDAEIRASRKRKVAKRMSPEHKLRQQKRLQALTSLTSGTLGITALGALATKHPKAAAKLTTVGAGVGGTSAFNFASIQNKEAKLRGPKQNVYVVRNKKQIKNIKSGLEPVKKEFGMDFGLDTVHQGENIEEIDKAFALRLGAARHGYAPLHGVKGAANYKPAHAPKQPGRHRGAQAEQGGSHLKVKEPKKKTKLVPVAAPAAAAPVKKPPMATWTPAPAAAAAPSPKKSTLKPFLAGGAVGGATIGGGTYLGTKKKIVNKRYSAEGNRRKRLDRYATGANVGAAALGAGAGATAVRAIQLKSLKHGGIAGGLGLGAIGMDVASHRIRSYKSGKGATYRPLARRPRD